MDIKESIELVESAVQDLIDMCPHCGAKVHIERLWYDYHQMRNRDIEYYIIFRCKPCKKLLLKTFVFEQNPLYPDELLELKGWKEKYPTLIEDHLTVDEKKYISERILSDYEEALKCKAIGAHRASCSMFRRSLQNCLIALGANHELDLIKQIESLTNLPSDIKDWAHQIRIFGNWGAHPDKDNLKDIDGNDVNEVHDFISKFLVYMFIMPEKVKLSRERRDKKSQGTSPLDTEK